MKFRGLGDLKRYGQWYRPLIHSNKIEKIQKGETEKKIFKKLWYRKVLSWKVIAGGPMRGLYEIYICDFWSTEIQYLGVSPHKCTIQIKFEQYFHIFLRL